MDTNPGCRETKNRPAQQERWTATEVRLYKNMRSLSSPVKSEIHGPKSPKKEQTNSLLGPIVWTTIGWKFYWLCKSTHLACLLLSPRDNGCLLSCCLYVCFCVCLFATHLFWHCWTDFAEILHRNGPDGDLSVTLTQGLAFWWPSAQGSDHGSRINKMCFLKSTLLLFGSHYFEYFLRKSCFEMMSCGQFWTAFLKTVRLWWCAQAVVPT